MKRAWHLVRNDATTDFIKDIYRYSDFGFYLDENLMAIQEDIANDRYYPKPLIEIDVPKSSLAVRPGSVPEIEDRIVTYAIILLIAPAIDKKLPEGVYSYRLKPGRIRDRLFQDHEILKFPFLKKRTIQRRIEIVEPWYAQWPKYIAKSVYTFESEGYRYMVTSDVVSYFENISLEILRDEILIKCLPREQKIINLLLHILEYWTWRSFEGKPVLRGIPQGNDVSSFLGNIYLWPLDEVFRKIAQKKEVKYFRYMDDVKIFTKTEALARECIFIMNDVLRKLHLNIQGEKTLIFKNDDIKNEIEDTRLAAVNDVINQINEYTKREKAISNNISANLISILKQQYKKIRTRKKALAKKDLRLFRRLMTAFTLLQNPYLVNRVLKEIERNPDDRLMINAVKYLRCFPNKKSIMDKLVNFLKSPLNQFALQEAQVLLILRYMRNYSKDLISYIKNTRKNKNKHWYVRAQAICLLEQTVLSRTDLNSLLKQFKIEKNLDIKRALIKPLCQLEKKHLCKFMQEAIVIRSPKITQVIRMLMDLKDNESKAYKEINSIFTEFNEYKLMNEFYKIEILKFSSSTRVKEVLKKSLRRRKRDVKHPCLLKKIDNILTLLNR
ncbi:MAG: RNA-directed DNA polymerase [candidate division WOR-3 bacterium]